ncbi:transposase [Denitrificimonas sp. JX-1]|uniref:Transposase n=1 Tax=Denitrificimonas halotolerans TaxID=3098930 RepID=A0ABU5GRB5_9GAMM|nr:transposase [Denitrificimonas sp. JX-1]MDY7219532.1 transposase [Denitrificimonas sp. JX-1]
MEKWSGLEEKLAIAQRSRNKTQVKTLHAKIANRRKDALHKFSHKLVNRCGEIYVGNVSSLKLVKTTMVKSVLDADRGQLKTMLDYKCAHAGIVLRKLTRHTSPKPVRVVAVCPSRGRKVSQGLE